MRKSNKIFILIIALLLVADIACLLLLFSGKKYDADDHHGAMRNYLKSEVGFSDQQLQQYDTIKAIHHAQVTAMLDSIRAHKKNSLYRLSAADFSDSAITNAAAAAAAAQENVEINMLNHLRNVRNLCTPAQRLIFDTGVYKIIARPPPAEPKNR